MGVTDKLQKMIFGKKAVVSGEAPSAVPKVKKKLGQRKDKKKDVGKKKDKKAVEEKESEKGLGEGVDGDYFTEQGAVEKFAEGMVGVQDLIAPAAIEVDFSNLKMNEKFFRTLFVLTYPNMLPTSWLTGVINLPHNLNISTFYYPIDSRMVMQKLRRKISEFQATLNTAMDEGKIPDPGVKVALDDAQRLQEMLAKNEEKYFHYALYITIQADSIKELNDITIEVESTLGTLGIVAKPASLEMEQAFQSTIPTGMDNLYKTRNMSTDAISATFPFVTSSLTSDTGVLYGLNRHNNSLVVFDRFSLENANTVVFATSGAGKSYMVKLEIYRSLMLGTNVIVIDPEREYQPLCEAVSGSYISFSQTGGDKINPFDLSGVYEEGENELADKRLFLLGLMKLMLGGISPEEKAILDTAIGLAYQEKGIVDDPATQKNAPPLMEDLYKILKGMAEEEAHALARRLEMYIKGAAAGVFDRPTSVDLNSSFTVFSLQELSDELRPIAMYMMLDYIWTRVRKDRVKRILVVDEAWYMMQNEDSARFLYWFAKRARKYHLGVTTITQDVGDFLNSKYGKAIVTNSALKILLKQSTAAIENLQKIFMLSEGEKMILLGSAVGEGLFFAGQNHVMIQVVSSEHEHKIVSTNPGDIAKKKLEMKKMQKPKTSSEVKKDGRVVRTSAGKVVDQTESPTEFKQRSKATEPVATKEAVTVPITPASSVAPITESSGEMTTERLPEIMQTPEDISSLEPETGDIPAPASTVKPPVVGSVGMYHAPSESVEEAVVEASSTPTHVVPEAEVVHAPEPKIDTTPTLRTVPVDTSGVQVSNTSDSAIEIQPNEEISILGD